MEDPMLIKKAKVGESDAVFIKCGQGRFESEAEGLRMLRIASGNRTLSSSSLLPLRVPIVYFAKNDVEIKMERIKGLLGVIGSKGSRSESSTRLALGLRRVHDWDPEDEWSRDRFGFPLDGQCGALYHENNTAREALDWVEFFRRFRLDLQLRELRQNHPERRCILELGEKLKSKLNELFSGQGMRPEDIRPSLLHGDLWTGNCGVVQKTGQVAVFDPAPFFGHFEFDFGIGRMFGGFMDDDFFDAYFDSTNVSQRPSGFALRLKLYEMYHHFNHLNIFGSQSYAQSTERLLSSLTSKAIMGT